MPRPLSALLILLLFGCDTQPQGTSGTAAAASKPEVSAATGVVDDGKINSLSSCLMSCEKGDMIPTNRETCRLNCEGSFGVQPGPTLVDNNADPVGAATGCLRRCYTGAASMDACAAACKKVAAASTSAPSAEVLDALDVCVRDCHSDAKTRPTDRATCELNCAQVARVAGPAQR